MSKKDIQIAWRDHAKYCQEAHARVYVCKNCLCNKCEKHHCKKPKCAQCKVYGIAPIIDCSER